MTRPQVPEAVDVLILGAGLAAAATASALRARGRSCVLLERGPAAGTEASGRSASLIREDVADEALADLIGEGARLHRAGTLAPFRRTGSFLLGRGEEDLRRRVPIARGAGRYFPDDGVVDAGSLLRGLLVDQALATRVEALRIDPTEPGLGGRPAERLVVATDAGSIRANVVVNAAGAWAGRLGDLPLEARKRHLFLSEDCGAREDWPFVWDDREGYYFRPQGNALLLCACDEVPAEPGDNRILPGAARELRAKLERCQRELATLRIRDAWAGQRTFAADGRFVVGWDPRVEGLFWLAGLGGHGVTASPALGRLAAAMILAGPDADTPVVARALAPSRLLPAR